jgi:hypothetical protein
MMVLIFFQDMEAAARRHTGAFARGNWRVDHDFVAHQQISALFRKRNANARVVRGDLIEQARGNVDRLLASNEFVRGFHWRRGALRRARKRPQPRPRDLRGHVGQPEYDKKKKGRNC